MKLLECITKGHIVRVMQLRTRGGEYYDITIDKQVSISAISKDFAFSYFRQVVAELEAAKTGSSFL